jgi:hypothetical protein
MSQINKLSFVLPITLNETVKSDWRFDPDRNADKRIRLLIKSFLKYFTLADLDLFLIICPPQHLRSVQLLISTFTNDKRFKVVSEVDLCPEIFSSRMQEIKIEGWYLQQMIKFAAADYIQTPFYVTLDSDVICRKPFQYHSLILNDQALMNIERLEDYSRIYTTTFAEKEASFKRGRINVAKFLLTGQKNISKVDLFYGETPVVFRTESVKSLCNYLTEKWRRPWMEILARAKGWSEITLYFEYLNLFDVRSKYYIEKGCNDVLDLERSIWHASSKYNNALRSYTPGRILGEINQGGFFVVIQSWLKPEDWLQGTGFDSTDVFYDSMEKSLTSDNVSL